MESDVGSGTEPPPPPLSVTVIDRAFKIGSHRRIRYQDVIAYKERIDAKRNKALNALAEQAQALKMGYE